jgi:hypothetical protein
MSARNKLAIKKIRKETRELKKDRPALHPHAPLDFMERLARQAKAAPIEKLLRLRRRSVVKAAGLSNALRRAQQKGLAAVFREPLRRAYRLQSERALVLHAEIEARKETCIKSPLRSCVPHKQRNGVPMQEEHPSGLSGEHGVVLDAIHQECLHGN